MNTRKAARWMLGMLGILLAGCGTSGPVACHPVSGQITYDGRPAVGVRGYLMPTSAPIVPQIPANPHAVTEADGRFKVGTYGSEDGAPEGGYQVVLHWPPQDGGHEESDTDRLLGWFAPTHTKLTAHVKAGENQ